MAEISILMPIYNAENYLEECLKSIREQRFADFEVLMIVDGATDTSLEICKKTAEMDNRFHVHYQNNQGSGRTRNNLIDWAMETESEYIVWIDADDAIHPLYLEHLYQTIAAEPGCDIVQCRYTSNNAELNPADISDRKIVKRLTSEQLLTEMLGATYGIDFTLLWNKIYRKDLYHGIRMRITEYFSGRMQDDVNILSQIYKVSKGCCLIDETLYYYRIVANSIQHQKINDVNIEYLYIYRDLYQECKGTELDSFANYLSERILFDIAGKLQRDKQDYVDYKQFYRSLKAAYTEFRGQINYVCRRRDLQILNWLAEKQFYAFRVYALLYRCRGSINTIFRTKNRGKKKGAK